MQELVSDTHTHSCVQLSFVVVTNIHIPQMSDYATINRWFITTKITFVSSKSKSVNYKAHCLLKYIQQKIDIN